MNLNRLYSAFITIGLYVLWLLPANSPAVTFTNNARIEISDPTGSMSWRPNGSLTVACWFKFTIPSGATIANELTILANRTNSDSSATHGYYIYFNPATGAVEFSARGTTGQYKQTLIDRPYVDRWYHVAVAMQTNAFWSYVDGRLLDPGTGTPGNTSTTNGISIGGWGAGKYLLGEVQEVAIYEQVLSGGDIQGIMFQDQRDNGNLVGYYKLGVSTNTADLLRNFSPGAAPGTAAAALPSTNAIIFEETDQAGEQSTYDSRKNQGMDALVPLSGAFVWSQMALSRPTPGISAQFEFGYSSATPQQTSGAGDPFDKRTLGAGWRHSFEARLVKGLSSAEMNLLTWNGASETWDRSPTNTRVYFTRHKEYRGELIKLDDGTDDHEWTTPARLVYRFRNPDSANANMSGRLMEIRDFNSNRVQIAWNEQATAGYITNITDSAGGRYVFKYETGSTVLTNISFQGWSVNFAYDEGNPRKLISKSLTNPSGLYTTVNTTWQFGYNATNGLLERVTDPLGRTSLFVQYDRFGRQTNLVDAINRTNRLEYNVPAKRQITRTDPAGFRWIETFDRKGRTLTHQDPLTNITRYAYDEFGNRNSVTDANSNRTLFAYDGRANLVARTNALSDSSRWVMHPFFNKPVQQITPQPADTSGWTTWTNVFAYDNQGNLTNHSDALGTLTAYTYLTNGLVLSSTDGNGHVSGFRYDTNGFLAATIDAAGFTNQVVANDVGWNVAQINALGQVTTFAYDLNGNVVRTVDPLQRVFTKAYDSVGNLLSASDAKGQFTFHSYDGANQRTQTVDRASATNRFFYTSRGKLDRAIDPLGNSVTNFYDAANRNIAASDPLGQSVTNVFDANGNLVRMFDKLGRPWSKTYDPLNRVIAETDPLGGTRVTTYDTAGRVKTVATPNGFATTHDYDGRGRLAKWVDAENFRWLYAYDGAGNITNITDALEGHYFMAYGPRNERTLERNQDNQKWHYAYDELGRLKQQTNANGLTRTADYDAGGRLSTVWFNSGRFDSYYYDDNNNLELVSRNTAAQATSTQFHYDALDRVADTTDTFGKRVRYSYDPLGRVTALAYPDGKVLSQSFDPLGRLTNQVDWAGRQLAYAYDKANRLIRRTYPNGIVQTNAFDNAGQITNLTYAPLNPQPSTLNLALSYAYDRNGNKTSSEEQGTLGWTPPVLTDETAAYTASGRLNNRQVQDALSNQLSTINYSYDSNGNLTNSTSVKQSYALAYDEDNRVTSLFWDYKLPVQFTKLIQNRYDALGRRISRKQDGIETRYVLNLIGDMERILCDTTASGQITAWYVHGPDLCYRVDATNGLLCYHADAQANIIALTDGNTNTVAQYAYTPYGRTVASTNFQSQVANPYLFVGSQGVMEELPGLYFMRARYYSAETGIFFSTDPERDFSSRDFTSPYRYANLNPLAFNDPDGRLFVVQGNDTTFNKQVSTALASIYKALAANVNNVGKQLEAANKAKQQTVKQLNSSPKDKNFKAKNNSAIKLVNSLTTRLTKAQTALKQFVKILNDKTTTVAIAKVAATQEDQYFSTTKDQAKYGSFTPSQNRTIAWSPDDTIGYIAPTYVLLGHEIKHAIDDIYPQEKIDNVEQSAVDFEDQIRAGAGVELRRNFNNRP